MKESDLQFFSDERIMEELEFNQRANHNKKAVVPRKQHLVDRGSRCDRLQDFVGGRGALEVPVHGGA